MCRGYSNSESINIGGGSLLTFGGGFPKELITEFNMNCTYAHGELINDIRRWSLQHPGLGMTLYLISHTVLDADTGLTSLLTYYCYDGLQFTNSGAKFATTTL